MFFKPIGSNIIRLNDVQSTNNYTAELLNQTNLPNGTVIVSERQSMGKGQRGSSWESEPGKNLTFSTVIQPEIAVDYSFEISMMTALSIFKMLDNLNFDPVKMKWPNDIYVLNKKVAGILIENTIHKGVIKDSIIGIGLNVNQTKFENSNAASMAQLSGKGWDLEKVLHQLLDYLNHYFFKLQKKESLKEEYQVHTLGWKEKRVFLNSDNEKIEGAITGYSDNGLLLLETKEGTQEFNLKELKFTSF